MEEWLQLVAMAVTFLAALVNLQTALINAKLAKMRAEELSKEKKEAAPADTGSDL